MNAEVRARIAGESSFGTVPVTAAVLGLWFVAALTLTLNGALRTPEGDWPWPVTLAVMGPIAVFGLMLLAPRFRAWVLALDIRPLVAVNSFRMLGLVFPVLALHQLLPLQFALPAGIGDAVIAVGGLLLALRLYSPEGVSRGALSLWNSLGLLDFVVAVGMGTSSRSGQWLASFGAVPSDLLEQFPLALIPGFLVPAYAISHLIVLLQLSTRWHGAERIQLSGSRVLRPDPVQI